MLFDGFTKKKFADRTVESFAVFKDGITPEWEDPENKRGGEWSIRKGNQLTHLPTFYGIYCVARKLMLLMCAFPL